MRELCIFSPHSVIRDPPFSRMDLVSCRNLLIYFGPDIQNQVIPTFHYALRPGGYLFLGTSESVGQHGDLFAPVDKKHRIFQAREHCVAGPPAAACSTPPVRPARPDRTRRRATSSAAIRLRQAVEARCSSASRRPMSW